MDNAFKKVNFALWVKIAVYASAPSEKIYIRKGDNSFMYKKRNRLHSMYWDGYLEREVRNERTGYYSFTPTKKFKDEFKGKYKEISKKIRPDFTDETRTKMLNAFKF